MEQQSIDEILAGLSQGDEGAEEGEAAVPELFEPEADGFEWLITPEQFVDFWIAAIFLLVGTWQIITMFFLVIG